MRFFEEISSIPRPTFHEGRIADYLCDFAKKRGLECYRDDLNNVLIKKKGSQGREKDALILLQGHTDMVCEKNNGVEHDFLKDGIKLQLTDDGWLTADGTTLGADNGVAVAVMLYILDGADGELRSHPPLECLFTVSEEVGMDGVYGFDYGKLSARRMINMDSADEGLIISGCAGGQRSTLVFTPKTEKASAKALKISVSGLAGGHSGEDIHRGRANANKIIGRILLALSQKLDFSLASLDGGCKDNAIPREASALITTQTSDELKKEIEALARDIRAELTADDSGFSVSVTECELPDRVLDRASRDKAIFLLSTVQVGVFEMNHSIEGLVEYSRNLGVMRTSNDGTQMEFTFSARSAKPSRLEASAQQIEAYAKMLGMEIKYGSAYPGWIYAESSAIRDAYSNAYKELYGRYPEVTAIHAGLECGVIKKNIPDMDIISCGPVVINLHSPDEALNVASFERFFSVIKRVLEK